MTKNNNAGPFGHCNWNEYNLNHLTSIHWRASLVPAAAVIPAPIAYIKVVAVKKLVVEVLIVQVLSLRRGFWRSSACKHMFDLHRLAMWVSNLPWEKQSVPGRFVRNALAWNNRTWLKSIYWFKALVMINRNSRGHSYSAVRGEILRFAEDELMRKHLPRMFSLIKNES